MRILSGSTRVVFVIGKKAYKVARFRPFALMQKAGGALLSKNEFKRLYERHHDKKKDVVRRFLRFGLLANRAEWQYWQNTHDPRCAPAHGLWFWGLVLVQESVEAAVESDILSSPLCVLWNSNEEFANTSQYGRDRRGVIVIVDYATLA